MKKTLILSAITLSLVGVAAYADTTPAPVPVAIAISAPVVSAVTVTSLLQTLVSESYVVLKLEQEKSGFEAKVVTPEGFMKKIKFDQTGSMIVSKTDAPMMTMLAAVQLVEKAGYTSVSSVKVHHHDAFEIEALSPGDNKKVEVKVDAVTGEIKVDHDWL